MQKKIDSELTNLRNTSKIMIHQVLTWAKQEEALRTQALEAEQIESKMRQISPCRYWGSIQPPQRCLAYDKMCSEYGRMNHICAVCRGPRQAVHKLEQHEDGQINTVNTDHIICNEYRSSIATKLKTSIFTAL